MKAIFRWLRILIQPITHMQTRHTATNRGQVAFPPEAWLRPPQPRPVVEPAGLVLLACSVTSALFPAQGMATETLRHYQIPAQPMNSALMQFAAASGIELIFSADLVRGLKAQRLVGDMSWEQALAMLLRGSGLRYRMAENGSVTLEHDAGRSESTRAARPPTLLPSVKVYGLAARRDPGRLDAGESTDLARHSYRVTRSFSATRTDTPLIQLPQSVLAVDRAVMDDQQNITVSESLRNVSSVVPRHILYTPSTEGTLVRGFPAEQLLDGFTQYYNPGDRESTVNVQRIEVLKGSNALFYSGGSGSTAGGVIHLSSKRPKPDAFGLAGFRFGSHDFYQPYVDLNQPLNSNVLFRLTGEFTSARSNVELIDTQRYNINPAFTFTGHGDTTLTLQGKISRWRQPDYQGLPATGSIAGTFRVPRATYIGPRDIADSRSDTDAVWANLDHKLNERWRLNARARYARSSFDQKVQSLAGANFDFAADTPSLPPSTWYLFNAQLFQQQEESSFQANAVTTFAAAAMDHTLLIGADVSHLADAGFIGFDPGASGMGAGTANLADPSFPIAYSDVRRENNQFMRNTSYGGYAQLQSHAFQRLHTLLGLRLGAVDIDFHNTQSGARSSTRQFKPLPRLGAVFDLSDALAVFAGYSEGMRGQPFVNFASQPAPELSRQVEAGLKFDFAGSLSGQIALYQIERSQVAVADRNDPLLRSTAQGQQRSRGVEFDLVWEPLESLSVLASYAHTEARFMDELAGVPDGNRLPLVPENSGRLWINYRFQQGVFKGLSVGAGLYARNGAFLSNDNRYKSGDQFSVDAAAAYETRRFKLAVTVKNLTGAEDFQPYDYFDGRVAPTAGRAAFLSGEIRY